MDECHASEVSEKAKEVRCLCNRLLFVVNGENIEIKCPKCKRMVVISTNGIKDVTFS